MPTKLEVFKLVICDVREGSLILQSLPKLEGIEWIEVPNTRIDIGSYSQSDYAARMPERLTRSLPDNCFIADKFFHVTTIHVVWDNGEEKLEVCYQQFEGGSIERFFY